MRGASRSGACALAIAYVLLVSPAFAARSITLEQAVKIAVVRSPVFAAQMAQYRAVRAKYFSAKGALFPNVSVVASGKRSYGVGGFGSSGGSGGTPLPNAQFSTLGFNAQLSQLVFDGGRAIAGIRSAKEGNLSGYDTLTRQLQTLAYNVATAYYAALQSERTTELDAQIVKQYVSQERLVRAQIQIGAAAPSDLAQTKFQTEQKRVALIQAQGAQIAAESTFATTLGLAADSPLRPFDDTPINPSASLLRSPLVDYARALKRAELLRPDYLAALHSVESSKEGLRYSKLARSPLLAASAGDGFNSTQPNGSALKRSDSLGLNLTLPIFDQGLTNYNVALAASALDQSVAGLDSMRLSVESQVRSAIAGYVSAQGAVAQAQAELASAQTAFDASQARYKIGAATLLDLLTQQTNLSTAKTDVLTTQYNLRLAEQTYRYALGETKTTF